MLATTMSFWADGDPRTVAEFCRIRRGGGIENSYLSYEQMWPKTTSHNHSVRIIL